MIKLVKPEWEHRKKSNFMDWMLKRSGVSRKKLAEKLNASKNSLDNKFHRNTFTFDDFLLAADICGYKFVLIDGSTIEVQCLLNLEDFDLK